MTALTLDGPHNPKAGPTPTKVYLDVRFVHKDVAKQYGARWDASVKRWYYPRGSRLERIFSWRDGLIGTRGRELLRVPQADAELAVEVGAGATVTTSQYCKNYHYYVRPMTTLHLIYSWRKPLGKARTRVDVRADADTESE